MSLFSELQRRNVFRVAIAYSVTAWLVAQVAELAFDSFGSPDWVMKSLLFVLAVGLVFAILFAWAYEMTPEGIKREEDVDRSHSITQKTGRKLNYTIIAVLVAALAFSVVSHRWIGSDSSPAEQITAAVQSEKSIAVLPFVNMSEDPNNEYFSDGISEELLNVLVKVDGLRVASRTSSFSFKGTGTSIPEIARALKVEHVLEGSVRKSGDTIRITAQLIDVKTDSHLWSETYDRKLEDIFLIQDEISAHIADSLKVALGTGEVVVTSPRPTENIEAYENYLRGRHFWQLRGAENIRKAIELLTLATEADPGFARAWSSLAAAHITMPGYSGEPVTEHYPKALAFAQRALDLDSSIAEAHAVLGDLERENFQWLAAENHYLKAIELEPKNPTGYLWYAEHLACTGQVSKAHTNALVALDLDPFNAGVNSVMSITSSMAGDVEQGKRYLRMSHELGHPSALFNLITVEMMEGNYDEAQALVEANKEDISPEVVEALKLRIAAHSDPALEEEFLAILNGPNGPPDFFRALEYVRLGHVDEAAAILRGRNKGIGNNWMVLWLPTTQALRQHAVFGELLERDGIPDYWDNVGWPEQCSRQDDGVTCR